MRKKLLALGMVFLLYSFSKADVVYLTADTMKVGGGSYANDLIQVNPGDRRVPVEVYLRNTFDVAGFTLRLVYDSTIMYPYYQTVPESSYYQPTRSNSLPVFGGTFSTLGEIYFTGSPFFNPNTEFIAAGRGPIVEFYFNIRSSAPDGYYPIKLEEDTLHQPAFDNTLGDKLGLHIYIPVLANGAICVGSCAPPNNHSPVISSISSKSVVVGETLSFSVSAIDPDSDLVTLFAQNLPANSTFPQVQRAGTVTGTFTFIPAAQQAPDTLSVTFIARDANTAADTITVSIFVYENVIPPGDHAPVFDPLASQFTVSEGQNLTFVVGASDQDGDTVTLSADALPPNATFPNVKGDSVVSQTFSFTPDFTQGPGSVSVTFRAKDEHSVSTLKTVTITINAVPQDLLVVSKEKGGVPGSKGKLVPLILTNLQNVYGVQFNLHYDPASVKVDSFVPAPRINGFDLKSNLGDSSDQVTVLVFGLNNEIIPTGADTLLYLAISVDSLASSGKKPLILTNAWEAISTDPNVPAKELAVTNGFFTVDKFGDLNLDTLVNVGDAVSLIAYILGTVTLNSRQTEAADINRDSSVNVGDLVGIINTILRRPISNPIASFREPLASLRLEYDSLQAGSSGSINLWADLKTSIAGVQLKIAYDPQQLSFSPPQLTSRSSSFDTVYYKDDGKGNLTILSFSFGKNSIGVGQGNILTLPVVVKSDFDKEKLQLSLKEAILADPTAVVIPVDKGEVVLPKSFSLGQNYPNPFNPTTTIKFEIGIGGGTQQAVQTSLKVFNILGQRVKTLVDEPKSPGVYYHTWDGKDGQGSKVSSGIYFYQLRAGSYNQTKKMVLLK